MATLLLFSMFTRRPLILFCMLLALVTNSFAEARTINVCAVADRLPYQAVRNDVFIGLAADYLNKIAQREGWQLNIVTAPNQRQALNLIEHNECSVLAMQMPISKQYRNLSFSEPFTHVVDVMIGHRNTAMLKSIADIGDEKVGVINADYSLQVLTRHYPNINLQRFDNEEQGILALQNNHIDIFIASTTSLYSTLSRLNVDDFEIVGIVEPTSAYVFAVNQYAPELREEINQGLAKLSYVQHWEMKLEWQPHGKLNHSSYMHWLLAFVALFFLCAFVWWRQKNHAHYQAIIADKEQRIKALQDLVIERDRDVEVLSARDSSSGLYNRMYIETKATEEVNRFQRFKTNASMVIVELTNLDELLRTNPNIGHDKVIKAVAELCESCVREVDILARWSNDQYLIICPNTDLEAVKILAQRLQSAINNYHQIGMTPLQIACAISSLEPQEEFSDWQDRTARVLNKSKREGKGRIWIAE